MTALLYALHALCPGHEDLAEHVEQASRRHLVHPVAMVVLIHAESGCHTWAVNRRTGAAGATQILPTGNANPKHLTTVELLDPATNINLGARHLARCLTLCGALGPALAVYHGRKKCRTDEHARKLVRRFEHAFESVASQDRARRDRKARLRRDRWVASAVVAPVVGTARGGHPGPHASPGALAAGTAAARADALLGGRLAGVWGERPGTVDHRDRLRYLPGVSRRRRADAAALLADHEVT